MTKVKVEFFKYTGKWYDEFEFESELPAFELVKIKDEARTKKEFIKGMSFTIEVRQNRTFNKYLFLTN